LALDGVTSPAALPPEKNPVAHYAGCWVGHSAGLDVFENRKRFPLPGFERWTVQAIAGRPNDSAAPAAIILVQ